MQNESLTVNFTGDALADLCALRLPHESFADTLERAISALKMVATALNVTSKPLADCQEKSLTKIEPTFQRKSRARGPEMSEHQVRCYLALRKAKDWVTGAQLAEMTGVAVRTARMYAKRFSDAGIADCARLSPEHKYRVSEDCVIRNRAFDDQVLENAKAMGLVK